MTRICRRVPRARSASSRVLARDSTLIDESGIARPRNSPGRIGAGFARCRGFSGWPLGEISKATTRGAVNQGGVWWFTGINRGKGAINQSFQRLGGLKPAIQAIDWSALASPKRFPGPPRCWTHAATCLTLRRPWDLLLKTRLLRPESIAAERHDHLLREDG